MLWWNKVQLRLGGLHARIRAIEQIGASGDAGAIKALVAVAGEALREGNTVIQEAIANALGALGHVDGVPTLLTLLEKGQHHAAQVAAVRALRKMPDARVLPALVRALREVAEVRKGAVEALVELGGNATAALTAALQDKNKEVRVAAAEALAAIGAAAAPALVSAFKDASTEMRVSAAQILLKMGPSAVPALLDALRDEHENCRMHVAEILGELKADDALDALVELLEDPSVGVRTQAMRALEALGWQPQTLPQRARRAVARGDWDEAVKLGSTAIPPLIADFKDPDLEVRQAITKALSAIGKEAVPALIEALLSADQQTRFHAAITLAEIGDTRAVEPLVSALRDSDPSVRDNVVLALGKLGGSRAGDGLIAALQDDDHMIRARAARALGEMGDSRAVEALLAAARNADKACPTAALALFRLAPTKAIGPLAVLARQDVNAEDALMALTHVLETEASQVELDDLRAVTRLADHGPNATLVKRSTDPSRACQLAHGELHRRGLRE